MWSRRPRRASLAVAKSKIPVRDPRRASVSALGFSQLAEEVFQLCRILFFFFQRKMLIFFLFSAKTKGSNEDLNSGGNSKNIISEILKKFISRRPSSDLLRQKGILKGKKKLVFCVPKIVIGVYLVNWWRYFIFLY